MFGPPVAVSVFVPDNKTAVDAASVSPETVGFNVIAKSVKVGLSI
jgi:hypothetical protein